MSKQKVSYLPTRCLIWFCLAFSNDCFSSDDSMKLSSSSSGHDCTADLKVVLSTVRHYYLDDAFKHNV